MTIPLIEHLEITKPDDWHLHVRDGELLRMVVPDSARRFGRAIIMPNQLPPITTTDSAQQYRDRIVGAVPDGLYFEPLMTLFLTDKTYPSEIAKAKASGFVHGVKWYPAGATTNAEHGVREITLCFKALEAMEKHGLPLLVHAEMTDPDIDVFDREAVFLDRQLAPVTRRFSALRVVVEHVSSRIGVQFVKDSSALVGGTITAHYLLLNRNAMFEGGLRPHHYGLPRNLTRIALVKKPWRVALSIPLNDDIVIPFRANDSIAWQLVAFETDCVPTPP